MNEEYMTIDLIDMCKRILRKWKMVVIIAVIFALVFGAIGAVLGDKEYKGKQEFLETYSGLDNFVNFKLTEIVSLEDYEKDVISDDGGLLLENLKMLDSSISQYNNYNEKIEELNDYQSNGVFPNLNGDALPKQVLKYNISLTGYEGYDATTIVSSIGDYISFNLLPNSEIEKIISDLGWDITIDNFEGVIQESVTGYTYNVMIYAHNKEEVEIITKRIKGLMDKVVSDAKETFSMYNFSVKSVGEEYTENPEDAVLNKNADITGKINEMINSREKISNNLPSAVSDLYKKLFNLWQLKEDDIDKYNALLRKDLIDGKMIVIGGFLGALIVMAWIVIKCILKKALKTPDEIKTMFNSNILGTVDKDLSKEELDAITKNIEVTMKANDCKTCHLAGGMEEDVVNVRDIIKKSLDKAKIKASVATDSRAKNLENLGKDDSIIIFSKIDSSKYDDISFAMETAKRLGKKVIGFVVVK